MKSKKVNERKSGRNERIRLRMGIMLLVFGLFLFISMMVLFPREARMHEQSYYLFFIATVIFIFILAGFIILLS